MRLPADVNASNPLFGRLEDHPAGALGRFEDNVEIFDVMRDRLQALITGEDQRVEQETQSAATRDRAERKSRACQDRAQAEIKIRMRDRKVPRPVIEFLVQQWIKLLLVVQVKDGEESDAWKNALETMDLLISSVEPKETQEERRKLVTMVPDLLKRLRDGLNVAGVEDAVRLGFFAELRKLHSEVIGRTEKRRPPVPFETTTANDTAVPALTPVDVPSIDAAPPDLTPVDVPPVDVPTA